MFTCWQISAGTWRLRNCIRMQLSAQGSISCCFNPLDIAHTSDSLNKSSKLCPADEEACPTPGIDGLSFFRSSWFQCNPYASKTLFFSYLFWKYIETWKKNLPCFMEINLHYGIGKFWLWSLHLLTHNFFGWHGWQENNSIKAQCNSDSNWHRQLI